MGVTAPPFLSRSTFTNWWKVILILVLYDPVPTRSCYRPRKRYWSILPLSCHCAKQWLCLQQYSVFSPLCQCNWISGRWPAWRFWRVTYTQEFNRHICVYILHAGMFQWVNLAKLIFIFTSHIVLFSLLWSTLNCKVLYKYIKKNKIKSQKNSLSCLQVCLCNNCCSRYSTYESYRMCLKTILFV